MIELNKHLYIDHEGWAAANPYPSNVHSRSYIVVVFRKGDREQTICLTEEFLRHAVELLEYERNRTRCK